MNIIYRLWYKILRPAGLIAWLGEGGKHVGQKEAERRAKVCMGCPNMRLQANWVNSSLLKIKKRLGLKTQHDKSLSTCRSCGCYLPLKVWVPHNHIKQWQFEDEEKSLRKANPNCWQL